MPVRPEDYDEIVARIARKYDGSIRKGDAMENVTGISTGSLELDCAMGGRGVPQGRVTRFYGGYSSSKTLRTLKVIAEAQAMGLNCAYYNVEKQYVPEFAEARGVVTSELTIVEGTTIEEIGDKMESLLGIVHLHVVDSCSAAVSEDELNADIRDWRPGLNARAWGKVFRRINERFDHYENTCILVDQVRTNFKTGAEEAPGGRILDHQSSMTSHFKKGSWLFRNEHGFLDEKAKKHTGISGQMEPAGVEVKVRIDKSRVCRPFRTATMWLDLDQLEFDDAFELLKAAKHYGILDNRGAGYWYMEDKKVAQGNAGIRKFLDENPEIVAKIRSTALKAAIG